jgi:uncharacterized membrane protein
MRYRHSQSKVRSTMDGNLIAMLICLAVYITALGVASKNKVNLKGLAVISILVAFWFGFQWNSWIGILSVIAGIFVGVFVLKALIDPKSK